MATGLSEILLVLIGFVSGVAFSNSPKFQAMLAIFITFSDRVPRIYLLVSMGVAAGVLIGFGFSKD